MRVNKCNAYITKEEAILAMRKGRNKEESEWAISAVPATKVKRSMKIAPTYFSRNEERCPHCRKSVDVYNLSRETCKFTYCWRCGGALYRPHAKGVKNPEFNYKILTPEQAKEWNVERYCNGELDKKVK